MPRHHFNHHLTADFPEPAKLAIGERINNILAMFRDRENRARAAKQKIAVLKGSLKRVSEQLAVLQQEHFGASSEKRDGENENGGAKFDHGSGGLMLLRAA